MKRYVLDSYALIAYFTGEEAGKPVVEVLKKTLDGDAESFLCVVNWGEVYYITLRENGLEQAETFRKLIEEYPIEIVNVDQDLTLEAAYADTFAAALAKIKKAELVTGDKEFKSVEGEVKILWL